MMLLIIDSSNPYVYVINLETDHSKYISAHTVVRKLLAMFQYNF